MIPLFQPYSAYKPSGVDWLGDIPIHWEVRRTKQVAKRIVGGSTPSSSEPTYWDGNVVWVTPTDLGKKLRLKDSQRRITKEGLDSCSTEMVPVGTIVISSRAPVGKVALAEVSLCTNQGCKSLILENQTINSDFAFHAFGVLQEELQSWANGTTFSEISTASLGNVLVPLPPLAEQRAIVRYLDHVDRRIQRYIEAKERLIALLQEARQAIIQRAVTSGLDPDVPLKPSGVDWLGDVPGHWDVRRLRYLVDGDLTYGANAAAEYDTPTWPRYLRITDFATDGTLRDDTFRSLPPEMAKDYLVQPGDLLLARSGATVGKAFLVTLDIDEACHAGYLIRVRPKHGLIEPKFLFAFTQSSAFTSWKDSTFIISTIQNISAEKYANLTVPTPPLEEQKRIIAHLDQATAAIDSAIDNARHQAERMAEYRASLIAHVVTGKVDVRAAAERIDVAT